MTCLLSFASMLVCELPSRSLPIFVRLCFQNGEPHAIHELGAASQSCDCKVFKSYAIVVAHEKIHLCKLS